MEFPPDFIQYLQWGVGDAWFQNFGNQTLNDLPIQKSSVDSSVLIFIIINELHCQNNFNIWSLHSHT